jgi:hypothetical protein
VGGGAGGHDVRCNAAGDCCCCKCKCMRVIHYAASGGWTAGEMLRHASRALLWGSGALVCGLIHEWLSSCRASPLILGALQRAAAGRWSGVKQARPQAAVSLGARAVLRAIGCCSCVCMEELCLLCAPAVQHPCAHVSFLGCADYPISAVIWIRLAFWALRRACCCVG